MCLINKDTETQHHDAATSSRNPFSQSSAHSGEYLPLIFAFGIPHKLHLHGVLDTTYNRAICTAGLPMTPTPAADHIWRRPRPAVSCHSKKDKDSSGRQGLPLKEADAPKLGGSWRPLWTPSRIYTEGCSRTCSRSDALQGPIGRTCERAA